MASGLPISGGNGSSMISVHLNSASPSLTRGSTSNTPVPRTTLPRWATVHRRGGNHSVITIGSVNPTGQNPVHPVTLAPTPCPPRVLVAQIHSRCLAQSVASRQTRSRSARTTTPAATVSLVDMSRRLPSPVASKPTLPPRRRRQPARTLTGEEADVRARSGHVLTGDLPLTVWSVSLSRRPHPSTRPP